MNKSISLLIVDDNPSVIKSVSEYVSKRPDIRLTACARSGKEALSLIRQTEPDAVLLDITIPELDGIGVLKNLNSLRLKKHPAIIVYSVNASPATVDKALKLGAAYYLIKPQMPERICEVICDCAASDIQTENFEVCERTADEDNRRCEIERSVTALMHEIGMPAHIKGYRYARSAIAMVAEDMERISLITKRLYPDIAKIYHTTASRVERSIRHSINIIWGRENLEAVGKALGYTFSTGRGKPTNSEFIAMSADVVRLKLGIR